jgi:hypothetical protein
VRIIDFVDTSHPALLRMWDKRQRGYRSMGYRIGIDASNGEKPFAGVLEMRPSEPGNARHEVAVPTVSRQGP